jgi:hypothetical protein
MANATALICFKEVWDVGDPYVISPEAFDCSRLELCFCPTIQADSDIAGIGVGILQIRDKEHLLMTSYIQVTIAFSVSTALTLVFTIACVVLTGRAKSKSFNPWDNWLDSNLYGPIRKLIGTDRADRGAEILYAVVVSLSDSQLVTGLAIVITALVLTRKGTMDAWHFVIVTDLAWLSANTHLLSLLAIRAHQHRQPLEMRTSKSAHGVKYLRICLMLALLGMMLYFSYIAGWGPWYDHLSCPVQCIIPKVKPSTMYGEPRDWTIVNFVIALYGYPFSIICVLESPVAWIQNSFSAGYHRRISRKATPNRWRRYWNYIWIGALTFWTSDLEDMLEGTGWFIYGMINLMSDRHIIKDVVYTYNDIRPVRPLMPLMPSDEWEKLGVMGFGQLVPLLLLLLPILALLDSWAGEV